MSDGQELPIGTAIRSNAERDPDAPALTCNGETVTRVELESRTNRLARTYERLGVKQDDLVTIALPNSVEFYLASIAVWKLGATPQPVSARLPHRERDEIVELANPPLVVGVPAGEHEGRECIAAGFEPDPGLSDEPLPERVAASWKAPTSGGSTGRPKIILSGQPATTQVGVGAVFGMPTGSAVLIPGPLYHNAPFMFGAIGLFRGSHVVVMPRFDAQHMLELVELHRIEWTFVVPTMMSRVMRLPMPELISRDMSSLRTVWHGAAPCPPWVKEAWISWLGPEVIWELYAGTEGQGLCVIRGDDWLDHRGSVGRPVVGQMKIVGPDGSELPRGEVGEIYMLPPDREHPAYRYLGAEAKVADGWESIGDMGSMDADGYVYIADRRTDLILSGGANVYPAEVEAALDEHRQVATCAVIGLPDEDLGQRVHAIVQPRGEVGVEDLNDFLAERLVRYKVPRSYEFTDQQLRDDAGKVRRTALRDARLSG